MAESPMGVWYHKEEYDKVCTLNGVLQAEIERIRNSPGKRNEVGTNVLIGGSCGLSISEKWQECSSCSWHFPFAIGGGTLAYCPNCGGKITNGCCGKAPAMIDEGTALPQGGTNESCGCSE